MMGIISKYINAVESSNGLANDRYERVRSQIAGIVRRSVVMSLPDHPTVVKIRAQGIRPEQSKPLNAAELKKLAFRCGADDVGLVEIERPALDDQRDYIRQVFAPTRTLLSFVVRMNREPVRSPVRSVANQEFHSVYDCVNETARNIVRELEKEGGTGKQRGRGIPHGGASARLGLDGGSQASGHCGGPRQDGHP